MLRLLSLDTFRNDAHKYRIPRRAELGGGKGRDHFLAHRVDRRGRDDPFEAARQFRVQGYEGVCLQLGERDVLGIVSRRPSQLVREFPRPTLEHGVAEQSDPHPPDVGEVVARDVGRDLAPLDSLVQSRQRLGTKECWCEELVRARDLDLLAREVQDGPGIDDELSHRKRRNPFMRVDSTMSVWS